jgi:hypothetical protein
MGRGNFPLVAFNRGLLSPKALARVDLDRTKLSAEVYTNWLPKSQGSMTIRPGTKYFGSSLNDTGANFIEFVASTDDVALLECTHDKLRVWMDDDAHSLSLLGRPAVDTTVTLSDTGWADTSTGGNGSTTAFVDEIPTMTGATTNGVTITASTAAAGGEEWKVADDDVGTFWQSFGGPTQWVKVAFASAKAITEYTVQAGNHGSYVTSAPKAWLLQGNDVDTGSGWTTEDTRSAQTGWSVGERRSFTISDTGGVADSWRYWRLLVSDVDGGGSVIVSEFQLSANITPSRAQFSAAGLNLNATAIGSLARAEKRVIISDTGTEHSLAINVGRGPVALRVGSSQRDDDYINETLIGTGYHNLAFTPSGNFWITLQHDGVVDRTVNSLTIGDSGTVEVATPWSAANLANIRYDQSADVVYVDCDGVRPQKIERRGTGRSWSVVDYAPDNGPFLPSASSSAKLSVSHFFGNTTLNSDIPFFTTNHIGALVRVFNDGQGGQWKLGAEGAKTDPIKVTGISDTGTATATSERRIVFSVTGTWAGRMSIERSVDGEDRGFKPISGNLGAASDTGTFTRTIDDPDDNIEAWYRARIADTGASGNGYTSGVATVNVIYGGGAVNGIGRITGYTSNTEVDIEVLSRFSDTGPSDVWQQGYWSTARGFPSSVQLHGGRLCHAGKASLFLSESDDYEDFDDEIEGDAAPMVRTLGSGPVDNVHYLLSLLRLLVGTSGAELSVRSSSLDEPLTPDNSSVRTFSTQGSANLRALKMDTSGLFVQRSGQRLFLIGFGQGADALGDYAVTEMTMLVPDLLAAGVVSIAIQRQPDTRIHCVLADGTVGLLTYEPQEEVVCWTKWETSGDVEQAMVLPGLNEDAVYYHVNRTINGATKRYLEKWAMESECLGDTGLSFLADCAKSFTDTGKASSLTGFSHLVGASVVVWGDDTGQATAGRDLSTDDTGGDPRTYTVSGAGVVDISSVYSPGVHHAVAGLPYTADWKSTKLAYGAEFGTALTQMKRVDKIAFVLSQTHNRGLYFGSDTGHLDPLPRDDIGSAVDADKIYPTFDRASMPFPGLWNEDSRIHLRAKAPRPATVMAAIPTVNTIEK